MNKIKVLIVDDSALVRSMLTEILSASSEIIVIGTARDPLDAREKIKKFNPDVITLDVAMPKMDGITFLKNLMRLRPMPVVMISTLTEKGSDVTLEALEIGAVDYVEKPKINFKEDFNLYADEIIEKIKIASTANVKEYDSNSCFHKRLSGDHSTKFEVGKKIKFTRTNKIIAIGASTGGVEAIGELLSRLPAHSPAIIISQHIPYDFSKSFAERMNRSCELNVCIPNDGDVILPGNVYVAPGNMHLLVEKYGNDYICKLNDGEPVNRHKPSVDVMFRSISKNVGSNAIGILLTGMGSDGAQGLLEMRQSGATNIAQDEESSVVWGMPGSAYKMGAVDKLMPLNKIPNELMRICNK